MKINTKSSIRRHSPVIHGGKIPTKNSDHKIIDFSSNITPLGIPNSAKSIIKKNLDKVQFYPDPNSETVISNLEKYTHLPKSNIIVLIRFVVFIRFLLFVRHSLSTLLKRDRFAHS